MGLMFLIGIVVIIILGIKNNELTNKIFVLERENKKYNKYKFCPHCGKSLVNDNCGVNHNFVNVNNNVNNNYIQVNNSNNNVVKNVVEHPYKERVTMNSKEIKNSLILITGSVLIILSSILFLVSTWYSIHNIIKTLVIFLVLIVFFISSHIADKYLNLKQTSKAFYYIALAYIPIALLSIALFELFGKYLSLYGLGKYIYLSFSSLFVAIIYYYFAKKKDSKLLVVSSYVFQLLTIIFGTLIFSESFKLIMLSLIIYNIIFMLLFKYKKYYYNEDIHIIINTIFVSISGLISVFIMLFSLFNSGFSFVDIAIKISMLCSLYIYLNKNIKYNNVFNYVYPVFILTIFYDLSFLIDTAFIVKQLFIILAIIFICLYDVIKNNKLTLCNFVELSVVIFILYISSIICQIMNVDLYLKGFIVLIIYTLFSLLNYSTNDNNKLFNSYPFVISLFLSIIGVVNNLELPLVLSGFSILFVVLISILVDKLEINMRDTLNVIGNVFIWLFTCYFIFSAVDYFSKLSFIFMYALFSLMYSIVNKKINYRFISYIYFNIFLFIFMDYLKLDYSRYIIPFTTLIIYGIESYVYKDKELLLSKIYLIFSYILSFIILLFIGEIFSLLLLIISNMLFNKYISDYKLSNGFKYITYFNLIPYIYFSNILIVNNFNYMYLISLLFIINYIYNIYKDKENENIIIYYIYSFMHILCLEESKYIGLIILLIGTYIIYFIKNDKVKDMFKGICYTLLLILYNFIISDLKLDDFTVLSMGIYIVYLLIISRDILKKYINDYKVLEYIASSFIYFITLFMYNSEFDGLLFVMFVVIIVMICYMYKFGPLLVVSLIAIILNILLLTREFWLSIPWWIYILLIGSLLVVFAVYNEIKLKKDNDIKDKIKELKDDFDM